MSARVTRSTARTADTKTTGPAVAPPTVPAVARGKSAVPSTASTAVKKNVTTSRKATVEAEKENVPYKSVPAKVSSRRTREVPTAAVAGAGIPATLRSRAPTVTASTTTTKAEECVISHIEQSLAAAEAAKAEVSPVVEPDTAASTADVSAPPEIPVSTTTDTTISSTNTMCAESMPEARVALQDITPEVEAVQLAKENIAKFSRLAQPKFPTAKKQPFLQRLSISHTSTVAHNPDNRSRLSMSAVSRPVEPTKAVAMEPRALSRSSLSAVRSGPLLSAPLLSGPALSRSLSRSARPLSAKPSVSTASESSLSSSFIDSEETFDKNLTRSLISVIEVAKLCYQSGDREGGRAAMDELVSSLPQVKHKALYWISAARMEQEAGELSSAMKLLAEGLSACRLYEVQYDMMLQATFNNTAQLPLLATKPAAKNIEPAPTATPQPTAVEAASHSMPAPTSPDRPGMLQLSPTAKPAELSEQVSSPTTDDDPIMQAFLADSPGPRPTPATPLATAAMASPTAHASPGEEAVMLALRTPLPTNAAVCSPASPALALHHLTSHDQDISAPSFQDDAESYLKFSPPTAEVHNTVGIVTGIIAAVEAASPSPAPVVTQSDQSERDSELDDVDLMLMAAEREREMARQVTARAVPMTPAPASPPSVPGFSATRHAKRTSPEEVAKQRLLGATPKHTAQKGMASAKKVQFGSSPASSPLGSVVVYEAIKAKPALKERLGTEKYVTPVRRSLRVFRTQASASKPTASKSAAKAETDVAPVELDAAEVCAVDTSVASFREDAIDGSNFFTPVSHPATPAGRVVPTSARRIKLATPVDDNEVVTPEKDAPMYTPASHARPSSRKSILPRGTPVSQHPPKSPAVNVHDRVTTWLAAASPPKADVDAKLSGVYMAPRSAPRTSSKSTDQAKTAPPTSTKKVAQQPRSATLEEGEYSYVPNPFLAPR